MTHFGLAAKTGTLVLLFAVAPWAWMPLAWERVGALAAGGPTGQRWLFALAFLMSLAAIIAVPFLRSGPWRRGFTAVFVLSVAADLAAQRLTGLHMSADLMQLVWSERARPGPLFGYLPGMWPLLLAILLGGAACMARPAERWALSNRFVALPIIAFALTLATQARDGTATDHTPAPTNVPAQLASLHLSRLSASLSQGQGVPRRGGVDYTGTIKPAYRKIVYIVDESIRGDYLSLHSRSLDTTPFLASQSARIADFGVATSGSNCSAAARYILRTGLTEARLPDRWQASRRTPIVWQYAKRAGYQTVHLDAWRGTGPANNFHSMMTSGEAELIEHRPPVEIQPFYAADDNLANLLIETLKGDEAKFIFVEKIGLHFVYADNLPPRMEYEPRRDGAGLSPMTPANERHLIDYLKGLRWRVDRFFERVMPHLGPDTLVIYTSDHGQNMLDFRALQTHCTIVDAPRGEAYVPLFAIAPGPFGERLAKAAATSRDRATHFEIFPTVLLAMGYDEAWTHRSSGASLLTVPAHRKRRFHGPNIFGGSRSRWFPAD